MQLWLKGLYPRRRNVIVDCGGMRALHRCIQRSAECTHRFIEGMGKLGTRGSSAVTNVFRLGFSGERSFLGLLHRMIYHLTQWRIRVDVFRGIGAGREQ